MLYLAKGRKVVYFSAVIAPSILVFSMGLEFLPMAGIDATGNLVVWLDTKNSSYHFNQAVKQLQS